MSDLPTKIKKLRALYDNVPDTPEGRLALQRAQELQSRLEKDTVVDDEYHVVVRKLGPKELNEFLSTDNSKRQKIVIDSIISPVGPELEAFKKRFPEDWMEIIVESWVTVNKLQRGRRVKK